MGRLTLNPIAHFDPLGAAAPVHLGRARPGHRLGEADADQPEHAPLRLDGPGDRRVRRSRVEPRDRRRSWRCHCATCSIRRSIDVPLFVLNAMYTFVAINLSLFVFNLIPVPPLDGSQILLAALDPSTRYTLGPALMQYGPLILLVLIFTGAFSLILGPIIDALLRILVGL